MAVGWPGMQTAERADVNDSAACSFEMGMSSLRHQEWSPRIGFEHGIPLGYRYRFQRCGFKCSSIVDQQIEPAVMLDYLADGCSNTFGRAYVALNRESMRACLLNVEYGVGSLRLRTAIGDGNIEAGFREFQCKGPADSFRAARYQGNTTF